jgi:hypothetical protein
MLNRRWQVTVIRQDRTIRSASVLCRANGLVAGNVSAP